MTVSNPNAKHAAPVYFEDVGDPQPPCFVCGELTATELRMDAHGMFTGIDLHQKCVPAFRKLITAAKLEKE